jgi:hypothetical protein
LISDRHKNIFIKTLITLTVIILNFIRKPELLSYPRFYAEEGQSFFSFAYNHSLLDYIISPMYGYYALYNVLATLFATFFKLEIAPLITIYQALFIQVIVSCYAIWCDVPILNSNIKRFMVAISFPLLCPSQIWLTTIGVQYWLCIITLLVLLESYDSMTKPVHVVKAMVLFITGLTGVLSCMMTPVFILKWLMTKSKQFILYISVLCLCSIIQLCIFIQAYIKHDSGLNNRFIDRGYTTIQIIYMHTVLFFSKFFITEHTMDIPIINKTDTLLTAILNRYISRMHTFEKLETTYFILTIMLVLTIILLILRHNFEIDYLSIILSVIIIYTLSVILSINSSGGHRYRFAPMCMLMLFMIAAYSKTALSKVQNTFIAIIISIIILSQIVDFMPSMHWVYNDNWPSWKEEVRLWRLNNDYHLKIWPPPWEMILNKR